MNSRRLVQDPSGLFERLHGARVAAAACGIRVAFDEQGVHAGCDGGPREQVGPIGAACRLIGSGAGKLPNATNTLIWTSVAARNL